MKIQNTIAAIATPPGKGGVGIIRISGPEAKNIATKVLGKIPKPRYATFSLFKDSNAKTIDKGVALFFPEPHSFTGEDVLELQGHGGPVVMDQLLHAVIEQGAQLAKPGEFSERAFLNNKMDLAQAEAVADLINASSAQAAQSAMRSLQGDFSKHIRTLLEKLIQLRMMVEAAIDFPEEEIDFIAESTIVEDLKELQQQIGTIEKSAKQGVLLQEGLTVVITGKPNAGKSSLLNCLSRRDTAIVTDVPGTTRDVLREHIQIDGLPLHIIDTAGIRETQDVIEQEGVRRAKDALAQADLVILVEDVTSEDKTAPSFNKPCIIIKNKVDLLKEKPSITIREDTTTIKLSAKQQQGIDLLENHLKNFAGFESGEGGFIARRRHCEALRHCNEAIKTGLQQIEKQGAAELLAEDLRQAQQALSEITGEFTTEDLLGKIFSSFCIGK